MKTSVCVFAVLLSAAAFCQGHGSNASAAQLKKLEFLMGKWKGTQVFQMGNGQTMDAQIVLSEAPEVEGRFIQERSTTTLPGGRESSVVHMLGFDPSANCYKAWWFNDTSPVPTEMDGQLNGEELVLQTPAGSTGPTLKATYTKKADGLSYQLQLKQEDGWRTLFVTEYHRG